MTAEVEKTNEPMDIPTATKNWLSVIEDKLGCPLEPEDAALVNYLADNILQRWKRQAYKDGGGLQLFKEMYAKYKSNAQGFIVAVLEETGKLGRLEQMNDWRHA